MAMDPTLTPTVIESAADLLATPTPILRSMRSLIGAPGDLLMAGGGVGRRRRIGW
jgi:hypothetical protein